MGDENEFQFVTRKRKQKKKSKISSGVHDIHQCNDMKTTLKPDVTDKYRYVCS